MLNFILLITLCFFASLAGTLTGFGTATIMVPLLMFSFSAVDVLLFVGIIHWVNGLWRLVSFRKGFDLRLVMTFGLFGILASIIGAKISFVVDQTWLTKIIAVFLIAYSIFLFAHKEFSLKFSNINAILAGIASGFVAGISSMGGAIRAAFLASFNLPKEVFLANSALLLVLIDSARVVTYFTEGARIENMTSLEFFGLDIYFTLAVCVIASILGVSTGKLVIGRVPEDKFRFLLALFLIAVAIKLLIQD